MPNITLSEGFLFLILVLIPALVYLDATDHRIGRHPAVVTSLSAGAWAFWSLVPFIGPVVAIGYCTVRTILIREAALHPVVIPEVRRNFRYFLVLAGSLTSYGLLTAYIDADRADHGHARQGTPFYLDPTRIDDDR